uniref:tripartite motif-containing protein 16-like protein n=1 Tax=Maylandia zebra TaxID=106582 RepID=UPI000D2F84FD|nr:tripartite motif-containing protein 16-like protein [Maylandia zebra]
MKATFIYRHSMIEQDFRLLFDEVTANKFLERWPIDLKSKIVKESHGLVPTSELLELMCNAESATEVENGWTVTCLLSCCCYICYRHLHKGERDQERCLHLKLSITHQIPKGWNQCTAASDNITRSSQPYLLAQGPTRSSIHTFFIVIDKHALPCKATGSETEVSRVKELQEKLEQEITELKRKDAELKQLSHTEDHIQFLHNYPSLSALSESTDSSSINIRPLSYFEDVTAAVSEVRDKLQDILREEWTNISLTVTEVDVSLSQPEPKTRAGFLKYSCEITLDPNTAYKLLLLSEGNRKATFMEQQQSYSDHPDRFIWLSQVLSRESLTGRCYWEVEWRGGGGYVAVAYKNISRKGLGNECGFGHNDKSWSLYCYNNSFIFRYNNIQTRVSGPRSSRVGVYLDHRAGILSFYSVSETMTLLHRVQTTFTQPLYAGLSLYCDYGDTAELIKVK